MGHIEKAVSKPIPSKLMIGRSLSTQNMISGLEK